MASNLSVSLSLDIPPLQLSDRISKLHLKFSSSLHIQLPDSTWLMDSKWKELELIRGSRLCLKMRLRWHEQSVSERIVEEFGRWISGAEMWSQLLFSTSLQVPEQAEIGIGAGEEGVEPDIITAIELLLPKILPTASLTDITLNFLFSSNEPYSPHGISPSLSELMPLTDTAIHTLWSNKIRCLAPMLGKAGYLQSVSEKSEYINVITDTIANFISRSRDGVLRGVVEGLEDSDRIRTKMWRILLENLKRKNERPDNILKSLMNVGEEMVETEKADGDEESLLLFEEGFKDRQGDELLLDETDTEEANLFAWEYEDRGMSDSLFGWEDGYEYEDDTSLFEMFDNPVIGMGYNANKNDFFLLEHHEQAPEATSFKCIEDDDMIRI